MAYILPYLTQGLDNIYIYIYIYIYCSLFWMFFLSHHLRWWAVPPSAFFGFLIVWDCQIYFLYVYLSLSWSYSRIPLLLVWWLFKCASFFQFQFPDFAYKSPQVSRCLLSILADQNSAVICIASIITQISSSLSLFNYKQYQRHFYVL